MRAMLLLSSLISFVLLPTPVVAQEEKLSVPDETSRKSTLKEIKELFNADYAKRNKEGRLVLATKLLNEGLRSQSDPISCFVLLDEARVVAAEAGDVPTAFKAIDKLVDLFDLKKASGVDGPIKMKQDVLGKAQRVARSADEARIIAQGHLTLAREAAASGNFKVAQDSVRKGASLARKSRDKSLTFKIAMFSKEVPELKREYGVASKVDLNKAIDIGDRRTNLNIGRYLCFAKGHWQKGLEYLQWTDDKDLGEAAKKDLARPQESSAQFSVGEAWYRLAGKERNPLHKRRYQGRAKFWFEQAEPAAEGLVRLKVAKRLDELEELVPGVINLLRMIDPARDAVEGDWTKEGRALVCAPGPQVRIEIPYTPPEEYDLTVVAHRVQGNDAVVVGLVHPQSQFAIWIDAHPVKGPFTGFGLLDRQVIEKSPVSAKGTHLTNDRPNTIICSVRKDGVTLSVDGNKVLDWKGNLNRLTEAYLWKTKTPKALLIGAWGSQVRFTKIVLTPVSGSGKKLK